jgi:hypothetical protein
VSGADQGAPESSPAIEATEKLVEGEALTPAGAELAAAGASPASSAATSVDPVTARLRALSEKTGTNIHDLEDAMHAIHEANGELTPDQCVELLEKSSGQAQPKVSDAEIKDLAAQMAKLAPETKTMPESKPTFEMLLQAIADRVHVTMDELFAAGETLHKQGLDNDQILRRLEHEGAAEVRHLAQMAAAPAPERVHDDDLVALEVLHGSFTGGKCPDTSKRKFKQDAGFDYDAHHPAYPGEIVLVSPAEAARLLKANKGMFKKA